MVCHETVCTLPFQHLASHCSQRRLVDEYCVGGNFAEKKNDLWTDNFQLFLQPWRAAGNFILQRVSVLRRAAFDDIGNEYLITLNSTACRILVSSCPERPINGLPLASSSAPGASPITMSPASGFPSPNTTECRVSARRHFRHLSASLARASNDEEFMPALPFAAEAVPLHQGAFLPQPLSSVL